MPWNTVRGHDAIAERLAACLGRGKFPHALLFVGPKGVGKTRFARRLAQALLCESKPLGTNASDLASMLAPCESCPGCLQVKAETHPDFLVARRTQEQHELPIRSIRELCDQLALSPLRGTRRVAIVEDADALSEEASNAFLKTLEEPPPGSLLILVGTSPDQQLPTVRSRCQLVTFGSLSVEDLAGTIVDEGIVADLEEARLLAIASEGSLERARLKASSEFRDLFLGLIEELASARPLDASALARRVETYAKQGTASSLHRERAAQVVSELAEFFRDVLRRNVRAATHEDPEQNTRALPGLSDPIADAAEGLAQELRPEALFSLVERCLDATVQIDRKAHLGLILETLFAGFAGCLVAKRPVA